VVIPNVLIKTKNTHNAKINPALFLIKKKSSKADPELAKADGRRMANSL
jgi:hypothetical protein